MACGVALALPLARRLARGLSRRDRQTLALLALAAVVLTTFVAPRTSRIYYDEQIYQGIGQNLSDMRLAQMCNDGSVEYGRLKCSAGEYNKQPYAFPHLLSLAYRVLGVHGWIAFATNAAAMALSVASAYLLVILLFDDRRAAFFASLLLLLTPLQIAWSATAASEPCAALACVVAVLCAAEFSRSRDTVSLAATAVASAYAGQFRPESLLILPVVAIIAWPGRGELAAPRFWWVALLGSVLLAVHAAHLASVRSESWGASGDRLSLDYAWTNLRANLAFYVWDERFPAVFTALALGGLAVRGRARQRLATALWFVSFFGIYLLFYAGSYDYGADARYSLMTYAPLAFLGGLGAARVAAWLERLAPRLHVQAAIAGAIVFTFLWYAPLVRATTEEAWAARADVRFAESSAPGLRGNKYVLTHNPAMFHVWGVNAGQMSRIVLDRGYLAALDGRYPGGVYLHWNFWCNVQDPVQQDVCQKALAAGEFEPAAEYGERDQRFAFYRLRSSAARR